MNFLLFYFISKALIQSRTQNTVAHRFSYKEYSIEIPFTETYFQSLVLVGSGLLLDSFSLRSLWYFMLFFIVGEYSVFLRRGIQTWKIQFGQELTASHDQILIGLIVLIILFAPSVPSLLLYILVICKIYHFHDIIPLIPIMTADSTTQTEDLKKE